MVTTRSTCIIDYANLFAGGNNTFPLKWNVWHVAVAGYKGDTLTDTKNVNIVTINSVVTSNGFAGVGRYDWGSHAYIEINCFY